VVRRVFLQVGRARRPFVAFGLHVFTPHLTLAPSLYLERTMFGFLLWLLLLFLCWPLALIALILYPIVWLLLLPLRLLGITVDAVFSLLRAVLMLPARVLGLSPGR
jgi:hypothetical protein